MKNCVLDCNPTHFLDYSLMVSVLILFHFIECLSESMEIEDHTEHVSMKEKDDQLSDEKKMEEDEELKELQREFAELTEYLNKLEASYNQSLSYITGLEEIIRHVCFMKT